MSKDSTIILEILVLLAMSIFMHCLNKGSSIGEGSVLAKTMNRSVELRKEQVEISNDFPSQINRRTKKQHNLSAYYIQAGGICFKNGYVK